MTDSVKRFFCLTGWVRIVRSKSLYFLVMSRCVSFVSFVGERQVSINPKKKDELEHFPSVRAERNHVILLLFFLTFPIDELTMTFEIFHLSCLLRNRWQYGYNTSKKSTHGPSFLVGCGCLSWVGRLVCLVWLCDRDLNEVLPVLQYIGSYVCVGRLFDDLRGSFSSVFLCVCFVFLVAACLLLLARASLSPLLNAVRDSDGDYDGLWLYVCLCAFLSFLSLLLSTMLARCRTFSCCYS